MQYDRVFLWVRNEMIDILRKITSAQCWPYLLKSILVPRCDGIRTDPAIRTGEIHSKPRSRDNSFTVISTRLPHISFDETSGGDGVRPLDTVGVTSELVLAQLCRVHGFGGARPRGHGGEVLAVVGVGDGERGGDGPVARPNRASAAVGDTVGARHGPAERVLRVLWVVV